MYKRLFILFFFTINLNCFSQEIEKQNIDKAIDIINCYIVKHSLAISNTENLDSFKKNCNCEEVVKYSKIKSFINPKEIKTLRISEEIEKLKEYKLNNNKDLLSFLTRDIFTNEVSQSLAGFKKDKVKHDNDNGKKFDKLIFDISSKIEPLLINKETLTEEPLTDDTSIKNDYNNEELNYNQFDQRITQLEVKTTQKNSLWDIFSFKVNILSIFSSLILIWFFYKAIISHEIKKNSLQTNFNSKKGLNDQDIAKINTNLTILNNEISNVKNNNSEKITQVLKEIEALKDQISKLNKTNSTHEDVKKNNENNNPKEVLFFSSPDNNGWPIDESFHTFKEGASYYKLYIGDNKNVATFEFCNMPDSVNRALMNTEKIINSVCKSSNSLNNVKNPTKIITEKTGKAALEGNKWIVKEKAEIRYGI